jgi:hypothetical protein
VKEGLAFQKIKSKDYETVAPYFKLSDTRFCEFTVGTLSMWTDFFGNEFCIAGDALILSGRDTDSLISFTPPLARGGNPRDALAKLYAHAKGTAGYLKLYPLTEEQAAAYQTMLAGIAGPAARIEITCVGEDGFDYIYNAEDLLTLAGKKYHGQRNYVNRFLRDNAEWEFTPLGPKNLAAARRFAAALSRDTDPANKLKVYEAQAVLRVLDNYAALGLSGYGLSVKGKTAGLMNGEVIGGTLFEHIEKADKQIAGAYPFLSNQYIKAMKARHPEIAFVNREEDMGDPGVRYSKECYHPIRKNKKYSLKVF